MTDAPFSPPAALQRRYLAILSVLLFLFCLRVLGQFLVATFHVLWLPAMDEWMSGLVPYPGLLASQILIILLYAKICLDFHRGSGYFFNPRRRLGTGLLIFGALYLTVMILRYIMRMSLYPHERWTGGCIPIFFHWVLSSFILVLGSFHWRTTPRPPAPSAPRRAFHLIGALAAILCIVAWAIFQMTPSILAHRLGLRRSQYAAREQKNVAIFTSDGVRLVADIYHPQHTAHSPTILVRIPLTRDLKNSLFASTIGKMWAERGYTAIIEGTRGRFSSGGSFYPLHGERQDGIDTLKWIASQPWYDGRILTWGGSAFGQTEWAIADQMNPGPTAMQVYFASTDFYDMFYPGGAFSLDSALSWAIRSHGLRDHPDWPSAEEVRKASDGFPMRDADRRATGEDIPFFKGWADHPERDELWAEIDGHDRAHSLQAPVLLMAGWYDPFLPTQLNDFQTIRHSPQSRVATRSRLIIGPWTHAGEVYFPDGTHGENFRLQSLALSLPWFDENTGVAQVPSIAPVKLFVMGKNVWRSENEWPLVRTRYIPFYLGSVKGANSATGDGTLSVAIPTGMPHSDTYTYDPLHPVPTAGGAMIGPAAGIARQNDIEARPDVLVYSTPPLDDDLEVTGPFSLTLYVSTTAPNTDFTAKLVDVQSDGLALNISDGVLRHSYPEMAHSSTSSGISEIHIDLWPTSMVFLKGHRLRLEVSSSNFPRFDRNPNTGAAAAAIVDVKIARQTVMHNSSYPSHLMLPVVPVR